MYQAVGNSWVGATPARQWAGGYGAYGAMVPNPLPGQPDRVVEVKPTGFNYCGNAYGFQQMLADLGFYSGAIDGKVGPATIKSVQAFAQSAGVPFSGSLSDGLCARLIEVWETALNPPPSSQPTQPSTTPSVGSGLVTSRILSAMRGRSLAPTTRGDEGSLETPPPVAGSWWSQQSQTTKIAIGVGGAAAVGALVYVTMIKK